MIVKKDFLNKLKDFGLNTYEAKIWSALLSRGVSTAGELSEITGVPRSRSYDVLDSLERKGFIITKLGKPFKYLAVPPNEVIERVKKNIKNEAQHSVDSLDNLKKTDFLEELNLLHSNGVDSVEPTEFSGYVKTSPAIYNHIQQMVLNAKENVVIACSVNALFKRLNNFKSAFEDANKRNVNIRLMLPFEDKNILSKLDGLKELAEIKFCHKMQHRFAIADNNQVLLMLQDEKKVHSLYDTAVWVTSDFFVSSLVHFFDTTWNTY